MTSAGNCALVLLFLITAVLAQDYDVTDIQCTFASGGSGIRDSVTALLRKPEGFRGAPLFADDRTTDPIGDPVCQIRPESDDPTGLLYRLRINDFTKCGVLKRNGFVHVRIWFPQFPGVVMQSDQELIIMCKPPEPTIIENKAAGFAGSFPHGARVSGVVEETPGRLEYEVALYKEAPPVSRHSNHSVDMPVDQVNTAVPIGTKLQLRARINPDSAWRHIKLLEVAVSPDPDRPHAPGAVLLVKDGCRNRDFASIIPHQPARYRERHNEVFLDFEAFLLASMKERSTLWIHSQIKACMDVADCQPDYCLDLFEPSGHGRRRRSLPDSSSSYNITSSSLIADNGTTPFTRFKENLEYTVVMPGELFHRTPLEGNCATSMMVAVALGALLFMSALLMCYLATKLNSTMLKNSSLHAPSGKGFEQILRELAQHSLPETGYTGRPTVQ
ncbi:jg6865 [Pararge aegeria aegeria]|uniref:Jg6865 protein n=1 Tax=Pararge aegeria aegeria TaxID=348720 RepID=A0A8S4RRB1_9NEOP|nr:jg6865 [Pararge aegeria aegeria]